MFVADRKPEQAQVLPGNQAPKRKDAFHGILLSGTDVTISHTWVVPVRRL
jgi:hypothetical protein